jgi:hypothetical protein
MSQYWLRILLYVIILIFLIFMICNLIMEYLDPSKQYLSIAKQHHGPFLKSELF